MSSCRSYLFTLLKSVGFVWWTPGISDSSRRSFPYWWASGWHKVGSVRWHALPAIDISAISIDNQTPGYHLNFSQQKFYFILHDERKGPDDGQSSVWLSWNVAVASENKTLPSPKRHTRRNQTKKSAPKKDCRWKVLVDTKLICNFAQNLLKCVSSAPSVSFWTWISTSLDTLRG